MKSLTLKSSVSTFFLRSIPGAELISAVEPFLRHTHLLKHPSSPGYCHSNGSKGRQTNHQPPDFNAVGRECFSELSSYSRASGLRWRR